MGGTEAPRYHLWQGPASRNCLKIQFAREIVPPKAKLVDSRSTISIPSRVLRHFLPAGPPY